MKKNKVCAIFIDANALAPWQLVTVILYLKENTHTIKHRNLYVSTDQQFNVWQPFLIKLNLNVIRHTSQAENSLEILMALDIAAAIHNKKLDTVAIASTKRAVDVIGLNIKPLVETLLISPNRINTPFDSHLRLNYLIPIQQEKLGEKIVGIFVKKLKSNSEWVSAAELAKAIGFNGVNLSFHGYKNIGVYLKKNRSWFETKIIEGQLQCKLTIKKILAYDKEKMTKLIEFFTNPDAHSCNKSKKLISLCQSIDTLNPQQELELLNLIKYFPIPAKIYHKHNIEFEVRPIAQIVNYYQKLHYTPMMKKITETYRKENRTDAQNEFLCIQQLRCDLAFLHIYSDINEIIGQLNRSKPEHRTEWQKSVLEAYNKGDQRSEEEDKLILKYQMSVNERIHNDINRSIERGW